MGSMKFLVVLALIAMALAEPEADPALGYTTNTLPLTTSALHTPLVYNTHALQKPLVYTAAGVHHPLVYNSASHTPLVYHSYGKREAEAEPEAEADPALIYTNTLPAVHSTLQSTVHSPLVYTSGLHAPVVYNTPIQTPVVYKSAVHTPVVYNTPLTTPLLSKVFPSLKTAPVVSHIAK